MAPVKSRWKIAVALGLIAAAFGAWALSPAVRHWVATATSVLLRGDVQQLKTWLLSFGAWAPVISALLMIFQSVAAPLPAFVITFANGLVFGTWRGALLSWSSAMAGASLCFYLARALGRPAAEKLAGGSRALGISDRFFERHGTRAVVFARLLPFVPFDIISYGAGLTPMGFWRFFIATGIGQLPATIVYSWLGQNMSGSARAVFGSIMAVISLVVLITILKPIYERRLREATAGEPPPGEGAVEPAPVDPR